MKIEYKIWALLLLFIFVGSVVTFSVLRHRAVTTLNALERDGVQQAAHLLRDVYVREQEWLRLQAEQWAIAMAEFYSNDRQGGNLDVFFNLRDWFDPSHADFVVILRNGEVMDRLYFTPEGQAVTALPEKLERQVSVDPLLSQQGLHDNRVSGLIATGAAYYLVASTAIIEPDADSIVGTLIIGVRWDRANLWLAARRLGCGIKVYDWSAGDLSFETQEIKADLKGAADIQVSGDDYQGYKAHFSLVNLYGEPLVVVRVTRPFSQHLISHKLAQFTALILLVLLSVFAAILIVYLRVSVFGRLDELRSDLADIEIASHLRGAKVSLHGDDELGRFGDSINRLLVRLRRNRMRTVRGEQYIFQLLDRITDMVFLVGVDTQSIVRPNAAAVDNLADGARDQLIGIGLSEIMRFEVPDAADFLSLLLEEESYDDAGKGADIEQVIPFTAVVKGVDDTPRMVEGQAFLIRLLREEMALFIMHEKNEQSVHES